MPDPLDLGDLCELRDRLPSRAQALALPEDISVHEFLQDTDRSAFGLSLPHRWTATSQAPPTSQDRRGHVLQRSNTGDATRSIVPRPPSTLPPPIRMSVRSRAKLSTMEIASMPAVVGFESSDVPITYTEQYRAKKKLHNRNLLTSGSIDDQSWVQALSKDLQRNLQLADASSGAGSADHPDAHRVTLCREALHEYMQRQSLAQQSLLEGLLKEYDTYLSTRDVRTPTLGTTAQEHDSTRAHTREEARKEVLYRRKELEATKAHLQAQTREVHTAIHLLLSEAVISHTDLSHLLHSDQLRQRPTPAVSHDVASDTVPVAGAPDVPPGGPAPNPTRGITVVSASSTLASERQHHVYRLQQDIVRLERDISTTETFLSTQMVSAAVTDGLESMISDAERQLRMVELQREALMNMLSMLPDTKMEATEVLEDFRVPHSYHATSVTHMSSIL